MESFVQSENLAASFFKINTHSVIGKNQLQLIFCQVAFYTDNAWNLWPAIFNAIANKIIKNTVQVAFGTYEFIYFRKIIFYLDIIVTDHFFYSDFNIIHQFGKPDFLLFRSNFPF